MEQTKSEKKSNIRYWAWLLVLMSFIPLCFGGYPLAAQVALDTIGVETTGTVIDIVGDRTKTATPIIQFTTIDKHVIEFKSYYATNFLALTKGSKVSIRYLAANPQIAEVTLTGRVNYPFNFESTCVGALLFMAGVIGLIGKPLVLDFSKKR